MLTMASDTFGGHTELRTNNRVCDFKEYNELLHSLWKLERQLELTSADSPRSSSSSVTVNTTARFVDTLKQRLSMVERITNFATQRKQLQRLYLWFCMNKSVLPTKYIKILRVTSKNITRSPTRSPPKDPGYFSFKYIAKQQGCSPEVKTSTGSTEAVTTFTVKPIRAKGAPWGLSTSTEPLSLGATSSIRRSKSDKNMRQRPATATTRQEHDRRSRTRAPRPRCNSAPAKGRTRHPDAMSVQSQHADSYSPTRPSLLRSRTSALETTQEFIPIPIRTITIDVDITKEPERDRRHQHQQFSPQKTKPKDVQRTPSTTPAYCWKEGPTGTMTYTKTNGSHSDTLQNKPRISKRRSTSAMFEEQQQQHNQPPPPQPQLQQLQQPQTQRQEQKQIDESEHVTEAVWEDLLRIAETDTVVREYVTNKTAKDVYVTELDELVLSLAKVELNADFSNSAANHVEEKDDQVTIKGQLRGVCGICDNVVTTMQERNKDGEGTYYHVSCLEFEKE